MTVKGLEPELSRMAARQQQELSEQRSLHRAELEAVELRAARRTTELMDELRAELTRDKEEALKKEAALQRTRSVPVSTLSTEEKKECSFLDLKGKLTARSQSDPYASFSYRHSCKSSCQMHIEAPVVRNTPENVSPICLP